jgi:hypothetical protein
MADFDPAKDAINLSKHGISPSLGWIWKFGRSLEPNLSTTASPDIAHMDLSTALRIAWFSRRVTSDIGRSAFGARTQRK